MNIIKTKTNIFDNDEDWEFEEFPLFTKIIVELIPLIPYMGIEYESRHMRSLISYRHIIDYNAYTLVLREYNSEINVNYKSTNTIVLFVEKNDTEKIINKTITEVLNRITSLSDNRVNTNNKYSDELDNLKKNTKNIFCNYNIIYLRKKMKFVIKKERIFDYIIKNIKRLFSPNNVESMFVSVNINVFNKFYKFSKLKDNHDIIFSDKMRNIRTNHKILSIILEKCNKKEFENKIKI